MRTNFNFRVEEKYITALKAFLKKHRRNIESPFIGNRCDFMESAIENELARYGYTVEGLIKDDSQNHTG